MSPEASKEQARGEIDVEGRPAGWLRSGPLDDRPRVLLAHGAGAPFTSAFMEAVAAGLVRRGCTVVRFHFPYMERFVRDGLRRPPDREPVLLTTLRRMLELLEEWDGHASPVLAGKSMGGRMMSLALARDAGVRAQGAVYLGYPLHPAGRPERLRADHLVSVRVPQLFVSGTRDALCDLEKLRPIVEKLGPAAHLHVVQGGDHSLAPSRSRPLDGSDAWLDVVARFVRETGDSARGRRE